jgi:hypothetical protein
MRCSTSSSRDDSATLERGLSSWLIVLRDTDSRMHPLPHRRQPKTLAHLRHGGAPAQRHLPVAPALDVAGVITTARSSTRWRWSSGACGRACADAESEHGQGLGHALTQVCRGAGVGAVELGGRRAQLSFGGHCGVGVVGPPHPAGHHRAQLLRQPVLHVQILCSLCGHRHKLHYADLRIMPMSELDALMTVPMVATSA